MNIRKIGSYLIMIVVIMLGIFAVKFLANKYNIPVLSTVASGV